MRFENSHLKLADYAKLSTFHRSPVCKKAHATASAYLPRQGDLVILGRGVSSQYQLCSAVIKAGTGGTVFVGSLSMPPPACAYTRVWTKFES